MEPTPQSSRLTWLAVAMGAGGCALLGSIGADARWLAALGRTILAQGSVPAGIPYAAAPSVDWVNVPVLGELVFHALQVAGGDRGFLIAQLVATAAALALLALGMRALGAPDGARAVVLMLVFFAAAVVTLAAGAALAQTGEAISNRVGITGVVFGATILAAVTALPELSTGLAAVRIGDHELAITDIFGGNAFLPVLFLWASLLSGKPALPQAGKTDLYLAVFGVLLTMPYMAGLLFRPRREFARLGLDSIAVLVLYVVGVAGLVFVGR